MKTIELKKYKTVPQFFEINKEFVTVLDIGPGDKINILKDQHGYLSIYKCNPLESEKGFNVGLISQRSSNLRATITDGTPKDIFGVTGTVYECTEEPCWDESIEKLIFELNKIEG